MENYTQDNRIIRVETPLGKDVLLLQAFAGGESVSDLFEFDLTLHSTNHDISLDALIGEKVCVVIKLSDESERFINGMISEFRHSGTFLLQDGQKASILSHYQARLVPWFWALKLNRDCRIFQNKSVPEIVREIFDEHPAATFELRLTGDYAPREYCVQYRESDFNFVSRLLEEEGIFYFFEHSRQDHKLVLADNPMQFKPSAYHPQIDFASVTGADKSETAVTAWQVSRRMRSEQVELRDFNFRSPSLNLTTNLKSQKKRGRELEIYDYPGEYESKDLGEKLVRIRYEAEKTQELTISAQTNGRGLAAGYRFGLKRHPRRDFNREYVLLRVEHQASQAGNYRSSAASEAFDYTCNFTCFPHPTNFRPHRKTLVPKVQGTQTAIVVGPKGEEIFVDKHGRVKVHFHWDRVEKNAKSSCWIRVSQPWAGTGFGGITIPRIGQEVIVDFLEGDPDRPIITGRVYNGASRPPYELPANKAHSGLMSRSTPKGG
ncbi:MAG: type VI secretion system tip protein VgrG [Acidobacteriota bacterium]|nr:type VI secretion system tip protein VgrG [Acidobacteriota bacterium]